MFFEQRTRSEAKKRPWQNLIGVCYKCAGKLGAMDGDKTRLRVALKELIAEKGLKEQVRPVDVSCLDICPEGKITVAHFTDGGTALTEVAAETPAAEVLRNLGYPQP